MDEKVSDSVKKKVKQYRNDLDSVRLEVAKMVVGQKNIIDGCLRALLANGHVLIEGLPGVAKTLAVRTIASATGCASNRIQFTVDLLPADIIGVTSYDKNRGFYTVKGPIFANFIVADEINRAPPKTQSALLEAMQEKQVTISKETYKLSLPFFVMATINPIESGGVYPLPEAQLDRFLFKLVMGYPSVDEEQCVLRQNMSLYKFEDFNVRPAISSRKIIEMQEFVKEKVYLSEKIEKYILKIVEATRNPEKYGIKKGVFIEYGASPRASISIFISAKADALLNGSYFVTPQNVKNVAADIMRHRILLNYEGKAEGVTTDQVISEILSKVPVP